MTAFTWPGDTFDIIISDLNMPGVTGMQIIEKAKKAQPDTPIVILTGAAADDPQVKQALELGAKGLITKPFDKPKTVSQYLLGFIAS